MMNRYGDSAHPWRSPLFGRKKSVNYTINAHPSPDSTDPSLNELKNKRGTYVNLRAWIKQERYICELESLDEERPLCPIVSL